jgi:hypothetical protein
MTTLSESTTKLDPALIVFEQTSTGRQRGSWFDADQADEAEQLTRPMGYMVLRLTDEASQQVAAKQLPQGQISEGGASVPFVRRERLDRVLRVVAPNLMRMADDKPEADTEPKDNVVRVHPRRSLPVLIDVTSAPVPTTPCDWDEIKPGSVVLVRDDYQESWYEAVVLNIIGDICRLKWRDYPGEPALTRQRHQLGLMCPAGSSKAA